MVTTGLEIILDHFPSALKGKRIGILCHSPSITKNFKHITEIFYLRNDCRLSAIFGPQHGIHGQTQDNMIEWQNQMHPVFNIPLYSLYGKHRKPSPEMLENIDVLLIDLQDVGARLYTYIWTVKLCIEACTEKGIPIWLLDRPNPIGRLPFDGPVLKENFFTFVGGASIPLCHRMSIGEIALWIKEKYYPACDLNIVWMKNWRRSLLFSETGLPWVLPSPNMPTLQAAIVYPGTVLIEALNISEGRGTTIPFELFGAPFIDSEKLKNNLENRKIKGCAFRTHSYIPTFHKFSGELCNGLQIHVTDINLYKPVVTALEIFDAIIETSPPDSLKFNMPPYEYEYNLIPFDILSGDEGMRESLINRNNVQIEKERWANEIEAFKNEFRHFAVYPE
ncbi:MAG TPA: DUF1343 domain-containing protein [Bacteroidales bacterium]|nr:DUF1343 domain-containing protein [Bacteroidales bacterium]